MSAGRSQAPEPDQAAAGADVQRHTVLEPKRHHARLQAPCAIALLSKRLRDLASQLVHGQVGRVQHVRRQSPHGPQSPAGLFPAKQ